ncbi:MAG: PDZ domain-containing protein, partial [Rhodospirillales bacterium]|nr:PDZ domain-containing protein [Rhodospirillales bacterium]
MQPGDVIQSVNGTTIKSPRDLALNVANVKPGDEAKFSVLRDGKPQDVSVKVGQMPNERTASATGTGDHGRQGKVGLALAPLSP